MCVRLERTTFSFQDVKLVLNMKVEIWAHIKKILGLKIEFRPSQKGFQVAQKVGKRA